MITGKNYIGGELSSNSSVSFKTFNPLLNIENSISFYEASDNEIEKSTKLANDAFKIFKQVSSLDRSKFLNQISFELELITDDIVNVYCSETGLTEARCKAELNRTVNQLRSFAKLLTDGNFQEYQLILYLKENRFQNLI